MGVLEGPARQLAARVTPVVGRARLVPALAVGALLVVAVALAVGLNGRSTLTELDAADATGEPGSSGSPGSTAGEADRDSSLGAVPAGDRGDEVVVLFGDSFSEAAAPAAGDLFADDPDLRLSSNVYGGTQLDTPVWVRGYEDVPEGATVLLLLGTNDISTDSAATAQADATAAIDALTEAGARRVVVATVNTTGRPVGQGPAWTARARAFNDWLRLADASPYRYPTLQVVDWDAVSQGRIDWLGPDGVHHSPGGQSAYALMTHDAARAALGLRPSG